MFVKQLGAGRLEYGKVHIQPDSSIQNQQSTAWVYTNNKGGDINEFPTDLRVREFPKEALWD